MTRMPAAIEMDVDGGPEAEGARRATGDVGPPSTSRAIDPDPEVPAKVQRRRFSAEYRLRVLKQADACKKPGEVGALLRREGLYSSHLITWRQQRLRGALAGMRGPTATMISWWSYRTRPHWREKVADWPTRRSGERALPPTSSS